MSQIFYKGYEINPCPMQLLDGTGWTTDVEITPEAGNLISQLYTSAVTWPTAEEAVRGCIDFAQRIIDGNEAGSLPP